MTRQTTLRWAVSAAVGLRCFAGAEVTAAAQRDGVHVDPRSPAGKEYALPLESARRDAAGGGGAGTGSQSAPLFGAGISRRGESGTGVGADGGSRSGSPASGEGAGGGSRGEEDAGRNDGSSSDARESSSAVAALAEGGTDLPAGVLTALIALGVLVLGGIVGLSLRALRPTERPR